MDAAAGGRGAAHWGVCSPSGPGNTQVLAVLAASCVDVKWREGKGWVFIGSSYSKNKGGEEELPSVVTSEHSFRLMQTLLYNTLKVVTMEISKEFFLHSKVKAENVLCGQASILQHGLSTWTQELVALVELCQGITGGHRGLQTLQGLAAGHGGPGSDSVV